MTEERLKKANELSEKIKELQSKIDNLKETELCCYENEEDIQEMVFMIRILEKSAYTSIIDAFVSNNSARFALKKEIEERSKELKELQDKFSNL